MTYLIYITSCFVAGLLFIASPLVAVASQRIITGCKQGAVEKHVQEFPLQALGAVPNKILNWEVALARGSYKIRIASWHNFVPKIYTKSRNGEYRHAGINTATESRKSSNGRTFYRKEFSVTHNSDVWRNFWLLQIQPVQQNLGQKIEVTIVHSSCPKQKNTNCRCPPGSYRSTSHTFGQTQCKDRKTGKLVPEICN